MREANRVTKGQAIALQQAIAMTPTAWENAIKGMLREAEAMYGNRPEPTEAQRKAGKLPPAPDAGWWRDKDRGTPAENKRRIPGHLDFLYWRVYKPQGDAPSPYFAIPKALRDALPTWKRQMIANFLVLPEAERSMDFDVYFECKTGRGVPNEEQRRTIRRINRNPGAHAFVVYPPHRQWVREALGL